MKYLLSLLAMAFLISTANAQYKFDDDEFPGMIIEKKGAERKGYINLKGSEMTPWANQQSVKFFSEEAIADGKVKNKEREKFKPKDLKAYVVNDRYFESIKISAAKLSIGVGLPQYRFVERFVDGDLKLYKLYEAPDPAGVYVGEAEIAAHEEELERMRNNPLLVVQKGDDKYTLLRKVNLAELLADCPEVKEKYLSGGYGIEPWNPDAKSKLGKFISNTANAEMMENIIPEIFNDYNNCK